MSVSRYLVCLTFVLLLAAGSESRLLIEKRNLNQNMEALREYLKQEAKKNQYKYLERTSPRGPDQHHHFINSVHSALEMPNSSIMQASLVILLILSANEINIAEAKSYAGRKIMQRRIESQSIIHALAGYDLSAIKHEKRVLTGAARVAPGGPDPQHK
ncbi:hypothetical protein DITRI_Ditri19aG0047100 [Diplodiscus trichospermus]